LRKEALKRIFYRLCSLLPFSKVRIEEGLERIELRLWRKYIHSDYIFLQKNTMIGYISGENIDTSESHILILTSSGIGYEI